MKVLLATTLILFLMTSVSYSATNEMEVLESKGFHIINSPSDKGLWNTKESLEWLAIYMITRQRCRACYSKKNS